MTPEDIKRLNYIRYSSFRSFVKNPHNLIVCYILFIMKYLGGFLFFRAKRKFLGEVLFCAFTINNRKSIGTITENLSSISHTIWDSRKHDLPMGEILLNSIKHFSLFQRFYNASSREDRKLIRTFYESFMATSGCYEAYDKILKDNPQLKLIVFANDHSIENRCLLEIAAKHGVKTLYVQHASITERFPPLHFTYSFLDGMESFKKYKAIGDMKGTIFLTGSPRFDELYKYKGATKTHDIGIALNQLDSCDKVMELCKYLQDNTSQRIIVRPHPRMGNLFDAQLFRKHGIDISDSTQESSFSFLSKVKFLIANESSIHLDSALIGVPSFLYNFSDHKILDWYSYIKKGLIQVCDNFDDVMMVIKRQQELPVDKIQYYNSSWDTPIEGNVGAFIADFITSLISSSEEEALNKIDAVIEERNGYFTIRKN